jgi:hypothetical protein
MRKSVLTIGALVFAASGALHQAILTGQTARSTASPSAYSPPRTPDGHPDLQGIWDVSTITPVERPAGLPAALTAEQARGLEIDASARVENAARPSDPNRSAPPTGASVGTYNNFWIDRGSAVIVVNGERRSSLIIDPPDGRVPSQTPEAQRRNAMRRGTAVRPTSDAIESAVSVEYDGPELRPLAERCLIGFGSTSGPPTLPNYGYNNLKQIVQTKDHVIILNEMVHDVRIIRVNQPHVPSTIRGWFGDSVGRWEGDTLVVETTNFTDKTRFRGSGENLRVVERFRRVGADTILYQFTVEDPTTWVRPWTGEYPWVASDAMMHEYACHESNYALEGVLRGARVLEKESTTPQR